MHLNLSFFNKTNFPNFLYNHFTGSCVMILFGIILTYKTINPFYSIILILGLIDCNFVTKLSSSSIVSTILVLKDL